MSGYAIVLDGASIRAVVVGGGEAARRKIDGLRAAGATVRVIAVDVDQALASRAAGDAAITIERRAYAPGMLGDARLVFAATGDRGVDAAVVADARAAGALVNVAGLPSDGDFITPATHRAGDVVVAVTAAGVPEAAARIRDLVAARVDDRYATAVAALREVRRAALDAGDRSRWDAARAELLDAGFCGAVESGELSRRVERWR